MLVGSGLAGAQTSQDAAPGELRQLLYSDDIVDRPVILPRGLFEASVEMASASYDSADMFELIEVPMVLRIGAGSEIDFGLNYTLAAPEPWPFSRLHHAWFAARIPLGRSRMNALSVKAGAYSPTEDFRDIYVGEEVAIRRKVIPKLALDGRLGGFYDIVPDA